MAHQLSPVLGHLYNLSLSQEKVPLLWKTSCLVPVPKKSRPSDPAHYRPVALTSHVMRVLERLVQLRSQVRMFLDPLQFAYQLHLGVYDAVIYMLQRAHMHLDFGGGTVRITFFDFSSVFNTIQPQLTVFPLGLHKRCQSAILFPKALTFPIIIAGTAGLCFLLFSLHLAPDLQPRRLLRNSRGTTGLSPGSSAGSHSAISCSRV